MIFNINNFATINEQFTDNSSSKLDKNNAPTPSTMADTGDQSNNPDNPKNFKKEHTEGERIKLSDKYQNRSDPTPPEHHSKKWKRCQECLNDEDEECVKRECMGRGNDSGRNSTELSKTPYNINKFEHNKKHKKRYHKNNNNKSNINIHPSNNNSECHRRGCKAEGITVRSFDNKNSTKWDINCKKGCHIRNYNGEEKCIVNLKPGQSDHPNVSVKIDPYWCHVKRNKEIEGFSVPISPLLKIDTPLTKSSEYGAFLGSGVSTTFNERTVENQQIYQISFIIAVIFLLVLVLYRYMKKFTPMKI